MDLTGKTLEHIRLDVLIGRGGMGAVYRGFDLRLKRQVAVKVVRSRSRSASEARGRFVREARILSRLDHPGICRVYELIEHPDADLLVLELIAGRTLAEMPLDSWSLGDKLVLARDAADALAAAHRQLILHRDLKPDNVMVTDQGQVKLLDFGIARPLMEARGEAESPGPLTVPGDLEADLTFLAESLGAPGEGPARPAERSPGPEATFHTLRGATVGTVAYMSPEQALGHDLTVASDMYAFGILLQELFTGQRAYQGTTLLGLFQRVARAEPEPIQDLDPPLAELIRQLESRQPKLRPSAEEARDRLQALIDRPALERRRRRRAAALAAMVLLVVTALGAIIHSRFESRRQAALAERFAQEASAAEWFLRVEHLSPPHDLRPARQRVRQQLESLASRMPEGNRLGEIAGAYALGRAYLALNELQRAREHLQVAWDGGYRLPEVASHLGLALVRLHSLKSERAQRLPDAQQRAERLEELAEELARPGIEFLKTGRFASTGADRPVLSIEPEHYPQALVAFEEDRLDEALEKAATSARVWPWFYEADLLSAQILRRRASRFGSRGEYESSLADLQQASRLAAGAARVARSDPRVAAELCAVESEILYLQAQRDNVDSEGRRASFERGQQACRDALALDPEDHRSLQLLAQLLQRAAEADAIEGQLEDDPRPVLSEAAALARKALELEPADAPAWKALGDIYSMWADWQKFRGGDPADAIRQMLDSYQQAVRLHPREGRYLNALGNALCFRAELELGKGSDPRPSFDAAAEAFRRAERHMSGEGSGLPMINLAICSGEKAAFEIEIGADALDTLGRIDEAMAFAIEQNDQSYRSWRQLAETRLLQARSAALAGSDGRRILEQARQALERSLSIGADLHSETAKLATRVSAAWLDLESGEDPRSELHQARRVATLILDQVPQWQPALLLLGQAARLEAAYALAAGRGVRSSTAAGRRSLEKALLEDPAFTPAHLELGRLALLEAAAAVGAGGDPEPAWNRAEQALAAARELWPDRPDVHLVAAALARGRAEHSRDAESGHLRAAEQHLETALGLRGSLTDQPPPAYWLAGAEVAGQILWPI